MKINAIVNPNILKAYAVTKPAAKSAARTSLGTDEVSFSDEAISFSRVMAEVRSLMTAGSEENTARVAEIKASIADGTYHVSGDTLAEAILSPAAAR